MELRVHHPCPLANALLTEGYFVVSRNLMWLHCPNIDNKAQTARALPPEFIFRPIRSPFDSILIVIIGYIHQYPSDSYHTRNLKKEKLAHPEAKKVELVEPNRTNLATLPGFFCMQCFS